jgi:NADH-quinone oxidoreductase subunit L
MTAGSVWAIVLLPLAASLINALWGRRLGRPGAGILACAALAGSFALSIPLLFAREPLDCVSGAWIRAGGFHVDFHLHIDHLSAIMACIVSGIGLLIHIYSLGYMAHDERYTRFFSQMNLFAGSMLLLVLAGDLVLLYAGWEGVGLCSYLLIGHWFDRPGVPNAATKAMLVNRVGDAAMLLGIILLWTHFGSAFGGGNGTSIGVLTRAASIAAVTSQPLILTICLLLFAGATAKSAQLPVLWVWLPDAMAGPTPVSALIHAATMVTAGVYLLARMHVLFMAAPLAMAIVAVVGVATALFAATVAMTHSDIKKVLAYSTISQLGYMFLACGVGAFGAAIFHLFTHAFFKALLFLGAGSVMHALDDEQDMNRMGGLARKMPLTYLTFLAGALSLSALPIWAGFFSKEAVLSAAFAYGPWLYVIGVLTALLTAYYSFRQVWMVFLGAPREAVVARGDEAHDPPPSMAVPLVILAVGATLVGFLGLPAWSHLPDAFGAYLSQVLPGAAESPAAIGPVLALVAVIAALVGLWWARNSFGARPDGPRQWELRHPGLARWIARRYYIEEVLAVVVVRGGQWFARLLAGPVDQGGIDQVVEGTGWLVGRVGRRTARAQSGWVTDYILIFVVGALAAFIAVIWRAWR